MTSPRRGFFSFPRTGIVTRSKPGPETEPVSLKLFADLHGNPRRLPDPGPSLPQPLLCSQNIQLLLSKSHPFFSLGTSGGEKAGRNICQVPPRQLERCGLPAWAAREPPAPLSLLPWPQRVDGAPGVHLWPICCDQLLGKHLR